MILGNSSSICDHIRSDVLFNIVATECPTNFVKDINEGWVLIISGTTNHVHDTQKSIIGGHTNRAFGFSTYKVKCKPSCI